MRFRRDTRKAMEPRERGREKESKRFVSRERNKINQPSSQYAWEGKFPKRRFLPSHLPCPRQKRWVTAPAVPPAQLDLNASRHWPTKRSASDSHALVLTLLHPANRTTKSPGWYSSPTMSLL